MKTKTGLILAIALIVTGSGCANINTIDRRTALPPIQGGFVTGTGPGLFPTTGQGASALAIHLDAPQRLAFAKNGFICAEPSPDALQAYAQSFSGGFNIPGTASAEVAQALATSAGSIGLRTQSITLMRDHLYRICEASYNDQITALDVAQLLRRSQDMTLGVLAVEQLTGAIVARQIVMTGTANANASTNLVASKEELDKARDKENLAEQNYNKKVTDRNLLKAQAKEAKDQLKAAPESTTEEQAAKETLRTKAAGLDKQLEAADKEVGDASLSLEESRKVTKAAKANFDSAGASATATAEGKSEVLPPVRSEAADKGTLKAFSETVRNIVGDIINKGHLTDSCVSVMNMFAQIESEKAGIATAIKNTTNPDEIAVLDVQKSKKDQKSDALQPLYTQCRGVFKANVDGYQAKVGVVTNQLLAYQKRLEVYQTQLDAYKKQLEAQQKTPKAAPNKPKKDAEISPPSPPAAPNFGDALDFGTLLILTPTRQ